MGRSRGGLTSKIHTLVDAEGRPVNLRLTGGQIADCTEAGALSFSIPPLGRSEAGGGLNALSHCAEEKAGASGKREGGRLPLLFAGWPQRWSAPLSAAFAVASDDSVGRWFAGHHAFHEPD